MSETFGPWAAVPGFEARVVDPDSGEILSEREEGEFQVRGYGLMQGMYKREREETFETRRLLPHGGRRLSREGTRLLQVTARGDDQDQGRKRGARRGGGGPEHSARCPSLLCVRVAARRLWRRSCGRGGGEGDGPVDIDLLTEECRRCLSSYKVPTTIVVLALDDIPYLSSSKPDRSRIKELLRSRPKRPQPSGIVA